MATTLPAGGFIKPASLPKVVSKDDTGWLRALWRLYIAIALLFGAYMAINDVLSGELFSPHFKVWEPFVRNYSSMLILFALIPLVVSLENRFRLDARPRAPIIVVHLAAALLFSLIHVGVAYPLRIAVYHLAGQPYIINNASITFLYETQKTSILYIFVLVISFAAREVRVRRANELSAVRLSRRSSARPACVTSRRRWTPISSSTPSTRSRIGCARISTRRYAVQPRYVGVVSAARLRA